MIAFLGNVSVLEVLFVILLTILPFVLGAWLIIEIIRYLRRH